MIPWIKSVLALLYLIDPRDTVEDAVSYAANQAPNVLLFCAIEIFFITAATRYQWKRRNGVAAHPVMLNELFCNLATGVITLQFKYLASIFFTIPDLEWARKYSVVRWQSGTIPTYIFAFVLVEFCYYWMHRAGHEINMLWTLHQVHHDSQEFNIAVAARRHAFTPYTSPLIILPLILCGVPYEVMVLHLVLNDSSQILIHTETIGRLPFIFELIFNTPSHHRVHHGRNPYCLDKNYGGFLIIFDRLFGTFQEELDDAEPVVYGVTTPMETANPVMIQVRPFVHLARKLASIPWFMSPMVLLAAPGWNFSKPTFLKGDPDDVPRVPNLLEEPDAVLKERFEPRLHWTITLYVFLNLALFVCSLFFYDIDVAVVGSSLVDSDELIFLTWFCYTFASMGCLGMIVDGQGFAAEAVRWAVTLIYVAFALIEDMTYQTSAVTSLRLFWLVWGTLSAVFCFCATATVYQRFKIYHCEAATNVEMSVDAPNSKLLHVPCEA